MNVTAILSAVLLVFALGSAAQAEQYSDADANFKVTVPDGWKAGKITNEYVKLMMVKAADKDHVGICIFVTQLHAETSQQTQAQIDAQMGPLVDEKFWQFALTMSPGVEEGTIVSSKTEVRNGRNVYSAVLSIKVADKASGKTGEAKGKEIMLVIPGQYYFVTCMSPVDAYPAMEGEFDTVLNSFEPLTDAKVAQNGVPGVSALTLYSGEKFAGVSQVVTQDTPDLSAYGWRKPAGSVSIAGAAPWEMCSGANYSGTCRVVNGAADLGNAGAVLSARRVTARTPAVLARSLQSDAARALGEAVRRAH